MYRKNFKSLLALLFIINNAFCYGSNINHTRTIEERIDSLMKLMTLEEKLGQMNQLHCENFEYLIDQTKKGRVGSVMSITDPNIFNKVQSVAINDSRLKIPMVNARDVIHGYKTIFPIPLGQAASFNPTLAQECAQVAAEEASAAGIRWTFSPMVDITHDPRWGRIAEGYGEDPLLSAAMGAATIKGYQGDDLSKSTSIAACAKHFAGYGATEGGRDYNSTYLSERTMRNLYLRPFQEAAKVGAATFMTSFNDNDGIPSSANEFLLKDLLRNEWNYKGAVVSDWESISEMINHGFCQDKKEAAMKAVNAGNEIEMVSETYIKYIPELIKEKKVSIDRINESVRNILRMKFMLGVFEHPYITDKRKNTFYKTEFLNLATEAAEESLVLLKNANNVLPLNKKIKNILVTGPLADAPHDQLGTWTFDGDYSHTLTPLKAIIQAYGKDINIKYIPGLKYSRDENISNIEDIKEASKEADVIIAFLGEESILSGEAHCLSNLELQGAQSELLKLLNESSKPIVTVIMAGRPLSIEKEMNLSSSLIYSFHPGTMGGKAIINTIFGKNIPSGKLPITFPINVGQIPLYYNHNNTGRAANGNEKNIYNIPINAEQTSLGNKSYYLDSGSKPLFSFGYGLSYTTFKYDDFKIKNPEISKEGSISVSFKLTNTGNYDATEIAQLYFRDVTATITRPVKELVWFERVFLKKGESKTVKVIISVEKLKYWNNKMKYDIETGDIDLYLGGNSEDTISKRCTIK